MMVYQNSFLSKINNLTTPSLVILLRMPADEHLLSRLDHISNEPLFTHFFPDGFKKDQFETVDLTSHPL